MATSSSERQASAKEAALQGHVLRSIPLPCALKNHQKPPSRRGSKMTAKRGSQLESQRSSRQNCSGLARPRCIIFISRLVFSLHIVSAAVLPRGATTQFQNQRAARRSYGRNVRSRQMRPKPGQISLDRVNYSCQQWHYDTRTSTIQKKKTAAQQECTTHSLRAQR